MTSNINFLDLFAGAGGLSEGFIRAGYTPIAHVEADASACFTLRTRQAYHWLKNNNQLDIYKDYLNTKITRQQLYDAVPNEVINAVINEFIGADTLGSMFAKVDQLLGKQKLDLVIGGPPCQAYSVAGRARDPNKMLEDGRNHLYIYYAEFLKKYQPTYFVFENVLGLLSAKNTQGESYFAKMKHTFEAIGYTIDYRVLTSSDYGVLQNRKRIILVGTNKKTKKDFYPEPEKWNPNVKVWDLLSDLPKIKAGAGTITPTQMQEYHGTWLYDSGIKNDLPVTWHQSRPNTEQDLEIYRIAVKLWNTEEKRLAYNDLPAHLRSHKNSTAFTDRFKVVAGNLPYTHTVVAHIAKDGHHYIHPDITQNRSLTPREAARIQTFPDDYFFENASGKPARTTAFKQIGNAVPVLLAQKIAEKLLRTW